jgi:hypothetical protein
MSNPALEEAKKHAVRLSREDQMELVRQLIGGLDGADPTQADLSRFAGTVKLTIDPLQFQKQIREEWP